MLKGKTESGFEYAVPKARLENYELIEALAEAEANPLALPRAVNMILGKEQADKLKEFLRGEDGTVHIDALATELTEIFQNQDVLKNS